MKIKILTIRVEKMIDKEPTPSPFRYIPEIVVFLRPFGHEDTAQLQ